MRLARTHPDRVLGFADEVWWSRFTQPALHAWTPSQPVRLIEQEPRKADPEAKALACYGLLRTDTAQVSLRFVDGRPVSGLTIAFLEWVLTQLRAAAKKALLLIRDNAAWHVSGQVRNWLRAHNRQAKCTGDVRIVVCRLLTRSPWLNPIEPRRVHGKRAIVEPERTLSAQEVKERICDYYGCEHLAPLAQPQL